jgi:hypothetical protein
MYIDFECKSHTFIRPNQEHIYILYILYIYIIYLYFIAMQTYKELNQEQLRKMQL